MIAVGHVAVAAQSDGPSRKLADPRRNETNWWTYRGGFRAFGIAWLLRLQDWFGGATAEEPRLLSAEEYERRFLQSVKEKSW